MNETNVNSFLEKEDIGKLMIKYSVPCIISCWWRRYTIL